MNENLSNIDIDEQNTEKEEVSTQTSVDGVDTPDKEIQESQENDTCATTDNVDTQDTNDEEFTENTEESSIELEACYDFDEEDDDVATDTDYYDTNEFDEVDESNQENSLETNTEKQKITYNEVVNRCLNKIWSEHQHIPELNEYYVIKNGIRKPITYKNLTLNLKLFLNSQIAQIKDKDTKNEFKKFLKPLYLAELIDNIPVISISDISKNFDLLRVKNGIYSLTDKNISSKTIITSAIAGVNYNPNAEAPSWEKFINDISCNREDFALYLQKIAGYLLYGYNNSQCFTLFVIDNHINKFILFIQIILIIFVGLKFIE